MNDSLPTETIPTPPEWFGKHEQVDELRFQKLEKSFKANARMVRGIHKRLDQMPTQADVQLLLTTIKNVSVGVGFIRISGRTALWIVSIGGAGIMVFRYWKGLIALVMNIHS